MTRLAIALLGGAQFCLNDHPPLPLKAGKASALLAYLAVEADHPHPRQTLAELLWPERTDTKALGALRFALSNLRTALHDREAASPFLLIDRSSVQLNPQAEIWVDVAAFQEQAAMCESAVRRGSDPTPEMLKAALALYRGRFLQGFNLGDSLDFESWALRTREQLERQWLRLLKFLGADQEAAKSYAEAAESYRAIIEAQPWDEEAHQCLMRVLAASDQHSAALVQYAACCQALDELGIEPGRDTQALYQRIKQQAQGYVGIVDEAFAVPFVARERELAYLDEALERALAGQGQVFLVTGEAGSGKSALMGAFARRALARHPELLVVGGRCDAHAGVGQPYQPFVESAQMLAGEWEALPWADQIPPDGQERLRQAFPQIAQALIETAPDLLDRFVNRAELIRRAQPKNGAVRPAPAWQKTLRHGAATPKSPTSLETGRLFEQMARFLTTLARQRPLVLLLDDLHWIDAASATLLFHLVRRLVHNRVLLVAAYRSEELNRSMGTASPHPLLDILTELQRYAGDMRVDLDCVDEEGFVVAWLEHDPLLSPNRLDAAFRTALAQHTGGNPLFIIELLRSLQAHNDIRRAPDGSWVSSPALNWTQLPGRVEAAIAGRIAHLPPEWRDWLTTASVEGQSFTAEVLARVHSVDVAALLRDLSGPLGMRRGGRRLLQAEGTRWLGTDDQPRRLSRYRFRHILFQAYLYQQLDRVERAQRHAAVGLALEELCGDYPEERARRAAEMARHFEAGELLGKAAAYHLEAGRQAVYLASPQTAIAHYRCGLALLAGQPPTPARNRLEINLYLALGAPFLSASGWGGPERQNAIQRALDLLQEAGQSRQGHPSAEWDEMLLALYAQADWLLSQGELEPAARLGEQILALSGKQTHLLQAPLSKALAHRILGLSDLFQGRFPEARQQLTDALTIYRATGQPATLSCIGSDLGSGCQAVLGFALAVSGYLDQAWAQASQSLNRAHRIMHPSSLGTALIFAYEVAVLRGDLPTLADLADELLHVGKDTGLQFFLAYGWAAEGYAQALHAEPGSPQAEVNLKLIRRGMRLWESAETHTGRGMWIVRLASACLQAGEIAAGLSITDQALTDPTQPGIAVGLAQIYRLRGELLLRQSPSDRSAAEICFHQAIDVARQQGAHTLELRAALSIAQLWQSDRSDEVRHLLADTYAWFTEGLDTPNLQVAAAYLED